ncbi:MAG: T9SS type A sorting domain-containing protein, partial [Fibrobacteres bacterium]|nr:T9SS type A sorting domain-containing protein [Fibrobacterota bacterium]
VDKGMLNKKLARGGSHAVYAAMGALRDSVRFTLLQDLALLLRLNFQGADTVYHPYWKVERGRAYTDSVGYGWLNPKSVVSHTERDNIVYNKLSFLTNTANWMQKGPNFADSVVEGSYKIKCNDADYIIRMCFGHPYYHGRVSYARLGPNITKLRPDGSDTLFKFAPGATYLDPLYGIKTDTIRVRGEQGLFLNFFGPVMYVIVMNSDGVNIDSVAFDKWPMPSVNGEKEIVIAKEKKDEDMVVAPNPFNPGTDIIVNGKTKSVMRIYSSTGRLVSVLNPLEKSAGTSRYVWNAGKNAGGIYFARITTEKGLLQRKLIFLK